MNTTVKVDSIFKEMFLAYAHVKSSLAFDAFLAIIAGGILTTLVFKLATIVKDMLSEGKGFQVKHFFEVGKQYMIIMAVIAMLPPFITVFEQLLAYTAEHLVSNIAPQGAYDHNQHILHLLKRMKDDFLSMDMVDMVTSGIDNILSGVLMAGIGSFFACAYDYIMHVFMATRYLMLLLMELVGPIAIVCLLNDDTRSSFFTWLKGMFGVFMLYPGFIIASVFADEYVANLITADKFPAFILVIFSFILKLSLLATVKAMVNKWL